MTDMEGDVNEPTTEADLNLRILAWALCADAQALGYDHKANPTMIGFDTPYPSCPRHRGIAAAVRADLSGAARATAPAGLREAAEAVVASLHGQANGRVGAPDPKPEDFTWYVSREAVDALRAALAADSEPACDYCAEGNVAVDDWHVIHDPEGIEGDARVPCPRR